MSDTPTERVGEGVIAKLRQRTVVQCGLAYAAGAWGFPQGLAYVSALFHWPEQLQKFTGRAPAGQQRPSHATARMLERG